MRGLSLGEWLTLAVLAVTAVSVIFIGGCIVIVMAEDTLNGDFADILFAAWVALIFFAVRVGLREDRDSGYY